jgi:hypothetical protein
MPYGSGGQRCDPRSGAWTKAARLRRNAQHRRNRQVLAGAAPYGCSPIRVAPSMACTAPPPRTCTAIFICSVRRTLASVGLDSFHLSRFCCMPVMVGHCTNLCFGRNLSAVGGRRSALNEAPHKQSGVFAPQPATASLCNRLILLRECFG